MTSDLKLMMIWIAQLCQVIHLKLGRYGREDMAHYLREKQEDTGGQGGDNGFEKHTMEL